MFAALQQCWLAAASTCRLQVLLLCSLTLLTGTQDKQRTVTGASSCKTVLWLTAAQLLHSAAQCRVALCSADLQFITLRVASAWDVTVVYSVAVKPGMLARNML
jgi:hypothetical protein